ncbi:unnamed protein product [Ranitomeya imitator]|uniref:PH domain-containing protein n=1 Tax=Ranitomeya imitator TaxID=111125 RepID=A0ABN9LUM0_9NEOB|nr:unnamed protein product [Ranitomeya imitator]
MVPPNRALLDAWDLNLVLSVLQEVPFKPLQDISLTYLSWKVVFYVAITSIRRVSELLALSFRVPFLRFHQDKDSQFRQSTAYSLHQPQGNKEHGTERNGCLYKKSDGIRKVWQKRKCSVKNGFLTIAHGTPNIPPAKLNLLTCQVKTNTEEKKCFDLISPCKHFRKNSASKLNKNEHRFLLTDDRTYHFQAEDEQECQM